MTAPEKRLLLAVAQAVLNLLTQPRPEATGYSELKAALEAVKAE